MLDQDAASPTGEGHGPAPTPEIVGYRPEFNGRAGEYFGIWIVNILLTIVTVGIYSAWAKVRTERYFYGNTRLAGSTFEYLADPIRILKGRLIAYAVVIALGLSVQFLPILYFALLLAIFACVPLIVFLSTRFRARYSAWRGLRFGFTNGAGQAYGPFMGWPILAVLTLSILYPIMKLRQHEYLASGHRFGTARFGFEAETGQYFIPYLIGVVMWVGVAVLMFLSFFAILMIPLVLGNTTAGEPPAWLAAVLLPLTLVAYAAMFAVAAYMRTRYTNLLWNNARLGEHRFESSLNPWWVIWLYGSNLVAVLCTLGLATPWAMVRLARYRAECFQVLVSGGIDDFVADVGAERSAAGAELSDALDMGVDIGL